MPGVWHCQEYSGMLQLSVLLGLSVTHCATPLAVRKAEALLHHRLSVFDQMQLRCHIQESVK